MDAKLFVIGGVVIVLGGIGLFMISDRDMEDKVMLEKDKMMAEKTDDAMMGKKDDSVMQKEGEAMTNEDEEAMMEKESGEMMKEEIVKKGSYEAYSPEKLALAENEDVILFFRASWCPTCRGLDVDIRARLMDIPSGVAILDVNYDNSTALKQKYGVTYQHTLVQVDSKGNQIAKWTGSPTLASLLGNVK